MKSRLSTMHAEPKERSLIRPTLDQGEEWLSVILHFSDASFRSSGVAKDSPISNRFDLSYGFWIEHLDPAVAREIVVACAPANFNSPVFDQQDHTYALVKRTSIPGLFHDFGGLEELASVVALSRLIHFTNTGLRNAARVSLVDGQVKEILAYQPRGVSSDVYGHASSQRNWLTESDGERLKQLMPFVVARPPLPRRLHNAYWHHEYAMRTYYVDHRWIFIITGLEALTNTSPYQAQKKFVSRVSRLAELTAVAIDDLELKRAYDLRSGLVHGQQFLSEQSNRLTPEDLSLYERIEEILRKSLLMAFEDESFRGHFSSGQTIDAFLPLA